MNVLITNKEAEVEDAIKKLGMSIEEAIETLKDYKRAFSIAIEALAFYADPTVYHAILIVPDRPAGEFADDVSDVSSIDGGEGYNRPMPGKLARETLEKLIAEFGDLEYDSEEESEKCSKSSDTPSSTASESGESSTPPTSSAPST